MGLIHSIMRTKVLVLGVAVLMTGCLRPTIIEVEPGNEYYVGPAMSQGLPPSDVPAPYAPNSLTCEIHPHGNSAGNTCTLSPAIPADPEGRAVTYVDGGSSCPGVLVNSTTGEVSFTGPAKATACVIAVKASNGSALSPVVVSDTITGQNNAPATPSSVSCPLSPIAGTAAVACSLTAAASPDIDNDSLTYSDGGSTCPSTSIDAGSGNATFTAPAKGATCVVRIRAYDGMAYSGGVSSAIITGASQAPNTPSSLSCTTSPLAQSPGNSCTLTAAVPADNDGDAVTYSDGGSSCAGVSVNSATGHATFTAPNKGASCQVKVRAYDGASYSAAVSSATITGANNAPAIPSSLSCLATPLGGSTGNSCALTAASPTDLDGDSVSYSDNGSTCTEVAVNATSGNATFSAPAKGATCVVRVRAYDGSAYSGAVASATITGQNNTPNAPATLSCNTTPVGGSLANSCTLTAASPLDPDSDAVTYSDDGSSCQSVSVNGTTGSATFTAPAKGATCVVKVRAYDGLAYSSATSSATITGQNNSPSQPASLSCPVSPAAGSTGNACTLSPASPADPDSDSVTYVDDSSTCGGTIVNSSTGGVTFTAPSSGGSCEIRVKAFDGVAYSSAAVASIGGGNNAPSAPASVSCVTTPLALSTGNGCTLTAASPSDPDGDAVTYSDDGSTCGAVSVNATTGSATFTAPAKNTTCIVKIRAHDGQTYSSATSSATITGQNNAPATPSALSCATTPAGGSAGNSCTLTAASPVDADNDSVTYSDDGSTCSLTVVNATTGNATFTAPASGGTCVVKVRAHDGAAYSGTVSSATITAQNNAPYTPASLSCTSTPLAGSAGNACTLTAAAPADPDGQGVTYADDGSTCASVLVNATTGSATFTAPAKNATCVVKVKAYDGVAYSASVSSATITGQNNAPSSPQTLTCATNPVAQSTANSCTLTAASPVDPDTGDSVTYSDDGSTCPAVSVNSTTGSATFTAPAKGGTCVMKVRAHDGVAYSTTVSSATITAQNRAPNAPAALSCTTSPVGGSAGNACTLSAAAPADPDGDSVTYSNGGSTCSAVSVDSATGNATFTAPAKNATCVVKVRAYDGTAYSTAVNSATITGQNNAPNTPASLSCNTAPLGGSTGNACALTAASPADPDGDSVSYSNNGSTCGAVNVTGATGAVTFTAPAKGITCQIKVRAHDGTAYSGTITSATITGQNNAPSIPTSLVCPGSTEPGSTGNSCTLTAASPADSDGDAVTYADGGSTCSEPSVSSDGATITFTAPASGATCVMKVKANDGAVYSSAVSSSIITGRVVCPTNFVMVPGNSTYGTGDFCVAKYQAKVVDSGGNLLNGGNGNLTFNNATQFAASRPDGAAWVNIGRVSAAQKCAAIGAGYHLITNAEWQTIARNIENVKENWSSCYTAGVFNSANCVVGTGMLNRGHSDFSAGTFATYKALQSYATNADPVTVDADPYFGTGNNITQAVGSGWEQKRTHTLSNGEVIWDMAGGVWQWVADDIVGTSYGVANQQSYLLPSTGANPKNDFGPAGTSWGNITLHGGMGYSYINSAGGAVVRGGYSGSGTNAGVFAAEFSYGSTSYTNTIGFRCAK